MGAGSSEPVHNGAMTPRAEPLIPTTSERHEQGRALRKVVPRSELGAWDPAPDRADPIDVLEAQAASRVPELVPIRYGRMAASPFAFFRGGAAIMAADLATTPVTGLTVQACGDAHVSNFGKFATPERNIAFDINDFDETVPGPWEWDVKRLCASLHLVARANGFRRPRRRPRGAGSRLRVPGAHRVVRHASHDGALVRPHPRRRRDRPLPPPVPPRPWSATSARPAARTTPAPSPS